MKPTIQHSRRGSCATRFLRSLVLVLFGLLVGNSARATETYSYSGPHSLTWTTNGSKYLAITRTGGYDSLIVDASLAGSSKFTLESQTFVAWGDTANDTGYQYDSVRYFYVYFSSSIADTSDAKLVIHDNHHADTISLVGYGTDDRIDYTIQWENGMWDTLGNGKSYANITIDSGSNTTLYGIIYNHRASSINVYLSLSDSAHWQFINNGSGDTLSLNGTSDSAYGRDLDISYNSHGVYRDSVEVTVSCSSPYTQTTSFWIFVTDPRYAPTYYIPTVVAPDFGTVPNDSSVCGTVTITDSTAQPITITAISVGAESGWSSSGMPTLPYTLSAWGEVTFNVCFAPGNYYSGGANWDPISVYYSDSSGLTGSVSEYAKATTQPCITALQGTVPLDEVMAGGYVQATASFVMHKDTVLYGGTGEVMPNGGTVQILSPTLPLNVHTGDTVTFTFRVTPANVVDSAGIGYYDGYYPLELGNCDTDISFTGSETDTTGTDLSLFQNETGLMALTTSNSVTVDTFWFDNNTAAHVLVSSVSLTNSTNFSLVGVLPHSPNDSLASGGEMGVIIQFDGDTNGFYHDSLIVVTDGGWSLPVQHIFNLEAMHTQGTAGVAVPVAISPASISIVPNPASGPVMISVNEAQKANIEIFDLLGNQIVNATEAGTSAYEWNASSMANGIYIVRANGVDKNGSPFVISERMVLNK